MCFRPFFLILLLLSSGPTLVFSATRMIIAENGGGSELIENTLPAVTLALTRNVDFLELQVVMTADNKLLVYRDLALNRLSNVAEIFPGRSREDGNYYAIDFTLNEIRQLRLRNVFDYGALSVSLGIPTLQEELSLIRRLETLLDKQLGIVLEIRSPQFHRDSGKDISEATLDTLADFHYTKENSKLYLQCYDPDELQRIHDRLLPEKQMRLPLIQMIGLDDDFMPGEQQRGLNRSDSYDWLFTNIGLRMVAGYAAAISLPGSAVVNQEGNLLLGQYIKDIHKYGLKVLVLEVNDKEKLPSFVPNLETLLDFYFAQAEIDGIYTSSFVEAQRYTNKAAALEDLKEILPIGTVPVELTAPLPQPATQQPSD